MLNNGFLIILENKMKDNLPLTRKDKNTISWLFAFHHLSQIVVNVVLAAFLAFSAYLAAKYLMNTEAYIFIKKVIGSNKKTIFFTVSFFTYIYYLKLKAHKELFGERLSGWIPNNGATPNVARVNAELKDGTILWNRDPKTLDWSFIKANHIKNYMKKR